MSKKKYIEDYIEGYILHYIFPILLLLILIGFASVYLWANFIKGEYMPHNIVYGIGSSCTDAVPNKNGYCPSIKHKLTIEKYGAIICRCEK